MSQPIQPPIAPLGDPDQPLTAEDGAEQDREAAMGEPVEQTATETSSDADYDAAQDQAELDGTTSTE